MKRSMLFLAVFCVLFPVATLSALSYDNNEFQRKSRAYSELATKAYDEGDYDLSADYARKAEENAALSAEFITRMIARADAQTILYTAHTRLTWAREKKAEKYFPVPFENASAAVASADQLFETENYPATVTSAQEALDALSAIREVTPLPASYKVVQWLSSRDCLWNIAANPAVYGDPLLWDKLYAANKDTLKQPGNPNLLMPGMIVTIPSLKGEYREGTYDPSITYDSFKSQVGE